MKFCKRNVNPTVQTGQCLYCTHPRLLQVEDLGRLQSVHSGQEPDGVRPDQSLQGSDWQGGAAVRAGVRHVQSDPTVTETGLQTVPTLYNLDVRLGGAAAVKSSSISLLLMLSDVR